MLSDATFDDIVAGFYRAAGGAIGWTEALIPFQRSMSAWAVHLHGVDLTRGAVAYSYDASDAPPAAMLDYIRTYHRIDPRAGLAMSRKPGEWFNCGDVFDERFVANDRFYQEFLIPYGGRYVTGVKLLEEGPVSAILGVHRALGMPPLNAAEFDLCKRIGGHLANALTIYGANRSLRHQGRVGMAILDRLRTPVVLIDGQRRVLLANPPARALLARKLGALLEADGRLCGRHPRDDGALVTAIAGLLREDGAGSAKRLDKRVLRTGSATEGQALGLCLQMLRPGESLHAFGDEAVVMLLLHDLRHRVELDPFVIAAAFDLTPGEARVAVGIVRGTSPDHIAQQHGVSITTVRGQLRSIYAKTGVTRQAGLVELVSWLPAELTGSASA